MCGIWAYIQLIKGAPNFNQLFADFMNMKARGPDMTNFTTIKNLSVGFHRLAIMDPTFHANQPYILEDGERTIVFVCNGEIYDFKELIRDHELPIYTNADCMTLCRLYLKYVKHNPSGKNDLGKFVELFSHEIKGEYAFLLFEFDKLQNLKEVVVGRDHIGIRPLYVGTDNSSIVFSSELKGIKSYPGDVKEFTPGTILHHHLNDFGTIDYTKEHNFTTIYDVVPLDETTFENPEEMEQVLLKNVREAVIASVKRRLVSDRPLSFLLSGGADSSVVAALSRKLLGVPINTYCCAISNESTDLLNARIVAEHIKSNHHEIIVSEEDAISRIRKVIYDTETWDTTSCRASTGQSIVCDYIGKNTDACVILCGEGPDEFASSYLHQWYAPSGKALHDSAMEYIKEIHAFDVKRADRNISAASCEGRVPLLDPQIILEYWKIPSEWRKPTYKNMEKWWLRKAFDGTGLLPDSILFRKKEAFSDGISSQTAGKSWFQILQDFVETQVSDEEFNTMNEFNCPTKEAYYYMKIFIEFFGKERVGIIPHYWQPKFKANGEIVDFNKKDSYQDPSARTLNIYKEVAHK